MSSDVAKPSRSKGRIWLLILAVSMIGTLVTLLFYFLSSEARGIGFFDQEIRVETDQSIRRVRYCSTKVDDELRSRMERSGNPDLVDLWREAQPNGPNSFVARIKFTNRFNAFHYEEYY
jgi:hypothetical protein